MRLPVPTARGLALQRDLRALLGEASASCDPADLWASSRDCWPRALLWTRAGIAPHPPDLVCWPANVEEVARVVRYAAEHEVAVVPFGGGSGVCGGTVPVRGGIALDLKRLAGAPLLDLAARTVEVEAGLNGQRLEELLNESGATLGHFPANLYSSTVGGWLATRSAGHSSSRYGKVEDLVLSLEAVDGTGQILRTVEGPSTGPDLTQLLVGSEGTLAVITRAKLRCWPKPPAHWLRGVRFPSLEKGLKALRLLQRAGLRPSVARLSDPIDALLAGRGLPGGSAESGALPLPLRFLVRAGQRESVRFLLRAPLLLNGVAESLPSFPLCILGFEGARAVEAEEEGAAALRLCARAGGVDLGPAPGERWLTHRYQESHRAAPLFAAGAFVDTMEVATTWDRLLRLHAAVRNAVAPHAFVFAHFSHSYLEGCSIDFTFLGLAGRAASADQDEAALELEEAEARYDACWKAALSAAAAEGATLSHHHGIGMHKQIFLTREHGEGMRQLRALKRAFDPRGILNPGKLLL